MTLYFYIDIHTNEQHGPLSYDELKGRNITPETYVWRADLADWILAGDLSELEGLFVNEVSDTSQREWSKYGYKHIFNTPPMPKTWLVEAIIVTLIGSPILGIIAIVYARKVEKLYFQGDYDGALKASKSAKMWATIGLFILLTMLAIGAMLLITGILVSTI